jgi:2-polyprenyl-6-methoxyphenol hydroxylase-like FAD-dependent oxidoreductase
MMPPTSLPTSHPHGHAIVIGGSIAGLLAARVLTNYYDLVTVVDRDCFPNGPAARKGVPQARHVHGLLVQGRILLEQLFPNLRTELLAAGAEQIDILYDVLRLTANGWCPRFHSEHVTFACSRNLFEWAIRQQLSQAPNLAIIQTCDVVGLLSNRSNSQVTGVRARLRDRTAEGSGAEVCLQADLVVDASGRTSGAAKWLEELGYGPIAETTINSFLGYASRCYARPAGFQADWKTLLIMSRPPGNPRAGALFPIEGNRWMVTLSGAAYDYPPTDEAGFHDFARSLASSLLYDVISGAQAVTPIAGYQRTENRLRHYEQLRRWPQGFVVLGDAVCAFNPIYGQGMTAAAQGAIILGQCLEADQSRRHGERTFAPRFQRQLAKSNARLWMMATGEDFRYTTTQGGKRDHRTRLVHCYLDRVALLASDKPNIYAALLEVVNLLKPPATLLMPTIMIPTVLRARQRRAVP